MSDKVATTSAVKHARFQYINTQAGAREQVKVFLEQKEVLESEIKAIKNNIKYLKGKWNLT